MSTDNSRAEEVRRLTKALNDAIRDAVHAGLRVDVETIHVQQIGRRFPVYTVETRVLREL